MFVTGMFNDISFGSYNVLSLDFWFIVNESLRTVRILNTDPHTPEHKYVLQIFIKRCNNNGNISRVPTNQQHGEFACLVLL